MKSPFPFNYLFALDKDSEDVKNYLRSLSEGSLVQLGCVLGLSYSRIRTMKLFLGKSMTVMFKSMKLRASLVSQKFNILKSLVAIKFFVIVR